MTSGDPLSPQDRGDRKKYNKSTELFIVRGSGLPELRGLHPPYGSRTGWYLNKISELKGPDLDLPEKTDNISICTKLLTDEYKHSCMHETYI